MNVFQIFDSEGILITEVEAQRFAYDTDTEQLVFLDADDSLTGTAPFGYIVSRKTQ